MVDHSAQLLALAVLARVLNEPELEIPEFELPEHSHDEFDALHKAIEAFDGHSHDEFDALSKAIKAFKGHTHEDLAERLKELEDKPAPEPQPQKINLQPLISQVSAANDDSIRSLLAIQNFSQLLGEAKQEIERLRGQVKGKLDSEHNHADLERGISDAASKAASALRELTAKADKQHGEHVTSQWVIDQAKRYAGVDGEELTPVKNWKPAEGADKLWLVRWNGASWVSIRATRDIPSEKSPDWFLVAKDGSTTTYSIAGGGSSDGPRNFRRVSTDTDLRDTDDVLVCEGEVTVTLLPVAGISKPYRIKRLAGSNVTLKPHGNETIDGIADCLVLNINAYSVDIDADVQGWVIL